MKRKKFCVNCQVKRNSSIYKAAAWNLQMRLLRHSERGGYSRKMDGPMKHALKRAIKEIEMAYGKGRREIDLREIDETMDELTRSGR